MTLDQGISTAGSHFERALKQKLPNQGRETYLKAVRMCEKAIEMAVGDYDVLIDSLNL